MKPRRIFVLRRFSGFFALLCAFLLPCWLSAAQLERFVSPAGDHTHPYTNWTMAATNIRAAVTAANENASMDVVWVDEGTYVLDETVVVSNVHVRGWTDDPWQTIADGDNAVRCFYLAHDNALLSGLTVRNGRMTGLEAEDGGGGIYIAADNVTVSNCVVSGNESEATGGGIHSAGGDVTIIESYIIANVSDATAGGFYGAGTASFTGCVVSNNTGHGLDLTQNTTISDCIVTTNSGTGIRFYTYGHLQVFNSTISHNQDGGISKRYNTLLMVDTTVEYNSSSSAGGVYLRTSAGTVSNCTFRGNHASAHYGGGVYVSHSGSAQFYNTLFADNSGRLGGAVWHRGGDGSWYKMFNCTIADNSATDESGALGGAEVEVYNGILYDNGPDSWNPNIVFHYSLAPGLTGNGNIDADENDPLFVNPGIGDYELQAGSPAINAGLNMDWMDGAVDRAGNPRIDAMHGLVDMGCYEYMFSGTLFQFY